MTKKSAKGVDDLKRTSRLILNKWYQSKNVREKITTMIHKARETTNQSELKLLPHGV